MPSVHSLALACVLAILPVAAFADRVPDPAERQAIESVLREQGFTSWGKIELDDGKTWEVDNAVGADGKRYDLDLNTNLDIIKRDLDD